MSKVILGLVGVAVLGSGVWYFTSNAQNEEAKAMAEKAAMEEKAMMEKELMEKESMEKDSMMNDEMNKDPMVEAGAQMKKEDMMEDSAAEEASTGETMMKKGSYAPYAESKIAMAETGDVVLFFKASWCPSCRALDSDITKNLEAIPAGLTILEVDYDNSVALKQKYGVTTQHTLVQVDEQGNLIKKWNGSPKLTDLVAAVQ